MGGDPHEQHHPQPYAKLQVFVGTYLVLRLDKGVG
jgi:hypothetical protein